MSSDSYFNSWLTNPQDIETFQLILLLGVAVNDNAQLRQPLICLGALCDYVEKKPILSRQEYESKHNVALGFAKDYTLLKKLESLQQRQNQGPYTLEEEIEHLNDLVGELYETSLQEFFNPQVLDILSNKPCATPKQSLCLLLTKLLYEYDILESGTAQDRELATRIFSTLFSQTSYAQNFVEMNDYDNNLATSQHIDKALITFYEENIQKGNIEKVAAPNQRLQQFVAQGVYLNKTDHEGNNWAWEAAKKNTNPYFILYMAATQGVNIFHKNLVGESAFDVLSKHCSVQALWNSLEFSAYFTLNFPPASQTVEISAEKEYFKEVLQTVFLADDFRVGKDDFTKNHLQDNPQFLSMGQDHFERSVKSVFRKHLVQEHTQHNKSKPKPKSSAFLGLIDKVRASIEKKRDNYFMGNMRLTEELDVLDFDKLVEGDESDDWSIHDTGPLLFSKETYLHNALFQLWTGKQSEYLSSVPELINHNSPPYKTTLYPEITPEILQKEIQKAQNFTQEAHHKEDEGAGILAFLYHNTHTSDEQVLECLQSLDSSHFLTLYQNHNILSLCLIQKREKVLVELLKNPVYHAEIKANWPEFAQAVIRKIKGFDKILAEYPVLITSTNSNGDNLLHWVAKHHHICMLPELIKLAPVEALTAKNAQGISFMGFIEHNEHTTAENKVKATAFLEKHMALRLTEPSLATDFSQNSGAGKKNRFKL